MGDLIQMPVGPPIELPDNPTPQDFARVREVRKRLEGQAKAGVEPGKVTAPSGLPPIDPGMSTRQKVQLGAAIPAAAIGLLGGPQTALTAGMGAHGGAGVLYDLATGSPRSNRDILTTGLTVMTAMHPEVRALPFAARLAATGLTNALGGATYDLATGQSAPTVTEQLTRGAGDVAAGTFGAGLTERAEGRAAQKAAEVGISRKPSLRPYADRETLMQWGEREGVPLSGADVSKSRTTAALEQFPKSQLLGGRTVDDFRTRQMQSLDDSVNRHLGRLEARGASGSPQEVGTDVANTVERLKGEFTNNANQSYAFERRMLGENRNFTPTNFRRVANEIIDEEGRGPYTPDVAARRSADPTHTVVTQPATPAQPGIIIHDDAGNPITLGAVAAQPEQRGPATLDWARGRRYLAQMGDKAYGKGDMPGEVSKSSVKRLHAALAQDMNEHAAAQGEDFVNFRNANDEMYGRARDVVRDRLDPLLSAAEKGGPESAYAGIFKPGARGHTVALREYLPRETFDRAAGTWFDQQVQKSTSAQVGDRVLHSPAQLRSRLKPFIDSGQIDEMFTPEEAQWIKDYYRHSPALSTAEKLVGNPSGTGQTVEIARTMHHLINPVTELGAGGAAVGGLTAGPLGAAQGGAGGAALGALLTTAAPEAIARTMYSEPGRRFFAWQGRPNPDSIRRAFYNQIVAHGMKPSLGEDERKKR